MSDKIQIEQQIKAIRKLRRQYETYEKGLLAMIRELTYEDKLFIFCSVRHMLEVEDEKNGTNFRS